MNDLSLNNCDREDETLPPRWVWVAPLEIGEAALSKMLDRAKHTEGRALPYLRNLNVRWGTFDLSDLLTMRFRDSELDRYEVRRGDLLICERGEPGRCAVWNKEGANMKYQKAIHRLRLYDGIDPYFVMYQFMHDAWHGRLVQFFTGSTIKHFTGESLGRLRLRVAPSNEQARIVAKIDELFSELDAGVASLKRARALLKKYRQAVLKAAVTGELTRDWRERRKGEIRESGAELLQRILKARRQAWEAAELKKLRAKGKPPKDDRWKQKYKEPQPPAADREPFGLPATWTWASVDQVTTLVQYGTSARCSEDGWAIPVLRMGNIIDGRIDFSELKFLPEDHYEFPELLLKRGDILFNRTNSAELVGKSAVYSGTFRRCSFASYLIRVRVIGTKPEFLTAFVNSAFGRAWVGSVVSQQVGQANVNGSKLRALKVPLPPEDEQEEIVERLDRALTEAAAMDDATDVERRRSEGVRQSILKAAFAGRLVPQDPNDEPASVLLERIRAERAARPRPARGRRRKAEMGPRQLELPG